VLARGTDGTMWQKSWTGSAWSSWVSLGGSGTSSPDVASWGSGRLDGFVRGSDGAIYHWVGSGGWASIGGLSASDPGAVWRTTNVVDVFVRATTGDLYEDSWGGSSWSGWVLRSSWP
jgi:hypothetical protein